MACKLQLDQSDDLLYVKKGNIYCGYRREYLAENLSKMEEGLVVCKMCFGIMREASLSNGNTSCLVCSATPTQPNPVKNVQESIEVLDIECPLLRDCDWKGKLSEAETHLKDCSFFLIQCYQCKQIFLRREGEEHETNSCPRRYMSCGYCGNSGEAKYKDKHLQFCSESLISCPNKCGAEFLRRKLSEHRSECELEAITCPYKGYGCKVRSMLRRDLLAHKKEFYIEHIDMSLVEIKQLKDENARLKKEQNEMKRKGISMKQLDGVEWEIKNLNKLKDGEELTGPTFYINHYKLRIYYIFGDYWDYFYLRRIAGEFDRNLGLAYITHYRVVDVNKRSYNESEYEEGILNYQLKIGTKSERFRNIYYRKETSLSSRSKSCSLHEDSQNIWLRFYFDVNNDSLKCLDAEYSKENLSHPFTLKNELEDDPWEDLYY